MNRIAFAKKDKELRQQALIDAANAVFAEHGFDAATTREIAERAGCAEGLIHRYFTSKRGLLLAILDERSSVVAEEFGAGLPETDCVVEEVQQILLREVDAKWERRDFMRVCISQAAIDPEVGKAVRELVQSRLVAFIGARLQRHQAAGRIRPDTDVTAIAEVISGLGFAAGFMYRIAFGASREETERVVQEAAAAIARGISTSPHAPEEVRQ
ncbi:MAG: TetR/AcrR family transcriptional regulator [Dehalococcoidia bacterium]